MPTEQSLPQAPSLGQLTLKCSGLYTFPNPLGSVPEGSLITAQNIVIDRTDTPETRRGLAQYGISLSAPFQQMYNFNTTLMGWDGTNFWYDSDGAGTWLMLTGSYLAPSGTYRIKGVEASKNMYFATSTGVIGLTAPTSTLYQAGVPYPLDSTAVLNTVVGGWFSPGNTVGYRLVLGYTDTNNNLHLSAPSQRLVFSNPTGGSDSTVTVTWYIPPSLPLGYFYQLYRTRQTADISSVPQDPGDEEYLVVQKTLTSTDISNKFITYTDATPDNLLGTVLYTNPSQETIAGANYAPPLCKDMVYYNGFMLYANTSSLQQSIINMITTQTVTDTLTIGGVVYTADSSENVSTGHFKVFTSGTPGQNIDSTARSLVHVINGYASNTAYWAIYTSDFTSLPGNITLQARNFSVSSFAITSSNGTVYSPQIPASGTTYSSTNDVNKHYVYISKEQIPEAVPTDNFIPVGTGDKAILRILALRTSIFVFKEDGIYRILGTDISNFTVAPFDSTVFLTAQDSAVLLNNQIWAMTNQGVVAVSDSGSVIMSRAIERDLITLSSALYTNFPSATFGIRYESDRHYMLAVPSAPTDTVATQIYIYNFLTNCWFNWPLTVTAGIVSLPTDDHLYLMQPLTSLVTRERKNWNTFDYAEFSYAVNITSTSGVTVHLTSTTGLAAGMTLYQATTADDLVGQSIIVSVDSGTQITVTDQINWNTGAATVYAPISVNVAYTPIGPNPSVLKHYKNIEIMFRPDSSFTNLSFSINSDFDPTNQTINIAPLTSGGWGTFGWGNDPWGGSLLIAPVVRTLTPRQQARAHWLNMSIQHDEALSNFAISGVNVNFAYASTRFK